MDSKLLAHINSITRYALGFVFIYHGLVPKILWLSPIEISLASLHNLDAEVVSPIAGAFEIVLGLAIIFLKRSLIPVYIAAAALVILLIDVIIVIPGLLAEAFNPVTINVVSIVLAYLVWVTQGKFET